MPNRKSLRSAKRSTKRSAKRSTKRTKKTVRTRRVKHRGGHLGSIPRSAIVSVRQDDYSAPMLVDTETAENMFDGRNSGF